jgi:hypothetical protein
MPKTTLYKIINLESDCQCIPCEFDFLFLSCGSDFRAYEVLRKCYRNRICVKKICLFNFSERESSLCRIEKKQYYNYSICEFDIQKFDCSIMDPSTGIKTLINSKINIASNHKIAIDISCFTKPYFYALLKYFKDKLCIDELIAFYTEPLTYMFSEGLYLEYHSTSGPLSIKEVPGFPGYDARSAEKLLIVLLGFDGELSTFIFDEIAPSNAISINGFPGYAPKFKDISMINNEKLLSYMKSENSIYFVRANNPFETFNLLCEIKSKHKNAFFNIAPLGTKPMALGACLYALSDPSVRIVYPLPEKYKNETSKKYWRSWAYFIPLHELG